MVFLLRVCSVCFVLQLFCAKVRSGMQGNYFPSSFCHKVYLKGNFFLQFFKCFQKDILRSRNSNNVQISFRSSRFPPSTIRGNFIVVSLKQVNGGSYFYLLWDSISNRNQEEARPPGSALPANCLHSLVWISGDDISQHLSETFIQVHKYIHIHIYMWLSIKTFSQDL